MNESRSYWNESNLEDRMTKKGSKGVKVTPCNNKVHLYLQ